MHGTQHATQGAGAGAAAHDAHATASGGGATPALPASNELSAALQAILAAVQQLSALIGGSAGGASASGGGATTQAASGTTQLGALQAAPGQVTVPTFAPNQYSSLDSKTLLGPHVVNAQVQNEAVATLKRNADGSVAKTLFNRPVPEDRAKAAAVVQRLMQSTARYQDPAVAQAAGYDFTKHKLEGGNLLHVSKKGDGLNLDDPNMLLYRKEGNSYKLIGVVLGASKTAPDLGMGTWHTHAGNTDLMKHIWFTPNDLDTAFQEATPPTTVI